MNRRSFLTLTSAIIGGIALEHAIPLGRVWSFPAIIMPANSILLPAGASLREHSYWSALYQSKVRELSIFIDWPFEKTMLDGMVVHTNNNPRPALYKFSDTVPVEDISMLKKELDFRTLHVEGPQLFGVNRRIESPSPNGIRNMQYHLHYELPSNVLSTRHSLTDS